MVMKVLLKGNYIRCISYAIAAGAFQPCWYSEHFQDNSKHNFIFKIEIINFCVINVYWCFNIKCLMLIKIVLNLKISNKRTVKGSVFFFQQEKLPCSPWSLFYSHFSSNTAVIPHPPNFSLCRNSLWQWQRESTATGSRTSTQDYLWLRLWPWTTFWMLMFLSAIGSYVQCCAL